EKEITQIVKEKLKLVGLENILIKMPSELSGGMKKRVALARAIILQPKYMIYDEPTTGLDPSISSEITGLILKMQRTLKITSIVVTHDLDCIDKIANRIIMLHQKKIIFDGKYDDFKNANQKEIKRFLRIS
ncbi:MAG TPA: ATP-binding cassette domain-containing protein, partial [Candidatus Cloacimonetes bacterium]|nr:ATP-binding cassette domain-containing protein [Candidatus Cloacimonadota bacterium]